MKNLLLILLSIPLLFSSCKKCKECEPPSDTTIIGYEYNVTVINDQVIYDSVAVHGLTMFQEICRDNFATDQKYKSYINNMEDDGYTCRSDFWN
jgi:hypothetical protein